MHRAHQPLGVGVLGVLVDFPGGAGFDNPAQVHHGHPVAHFGHGAQVVGDEEDGHAQLLLEGLHQLQDLGLNGHVQGGGGFVGNQEAGLAHQGHGDQRALEHAAGKFMGILVVALLRIGDAHQLHHAEADFLGFFLVPGDVKPRRLVDLVADGVHGAEGHHGLLEDHRDLLAADGADLLAAGIELQDVHKLLIFVPEEDLAGGGAFLVIDGQNGLAGQGLAAAGFAHQAQRFAGMDDEIHAAHRGQQTLVHLDVHPQVFHLDDGLFILHMCSSPLRWEYAGSCPVGQFQAPGIQADWSAGAYL